MLCQIWAVPVTTAIGTSVNNHAYSRVARGILGAKQLNYGLPAVVEQIDTRIFMMSSADNSVIQSAGVLVRQFTADALTPAALLGLFSIEATRRRLPRLVDPCCPIMEG